MKRISIFSLLALASASLCAQQLNKEIIIDREIKPSLRAVTRINSYPVVLQPAVTAHNLTFSDLTSTVGIPGMITTLDAAESPAAITISPYKGYASIGYFPSFNLGASAGYRIVNAPKTSLGAWMQYDGNSYKDKADEKLERNTVTFGADFSHIFPHAGRLDIAAGFTYNRLNRPWESVDSTYSTLAYNVKALWSARRNDMLYGINAEWRHFGLNNIEHSAAAVTGALLPKLSQNILSLGGGASLFVTGSSSISASVEADFVHYNRFNRLDTEIPVVIPGNSKTMGLITITPRYRYRSAPFNASVGFKAQVTTNTEKTFHIAPDVSATLRPADYLTANLKLGGGEQINELADLFNINPYMSPSVAYRFSHIPLTAKAAVSFGPFKGATVEISGGYAVANDRMTTAIVADDMVTFVPVDLRAWHYGIALDYKFNDLLSARVSYTDAPGGYRHALYLNPDRAKHILEAGITATPVDKLTIDATFTLRATRAIYTALPIDGDYRRISLGNSNSLDLGAQYAFFEWFSAYARIENILGNRALDLNLHERQGLKGLVGIRLKF